MGRVINLAAYARRPRAAAAPSPGISTTGDETGSIHIFRRPDGSRAITLKGVYAEDQPYAIEALADVISQLAGHIRKTRMP